MTLEEIKQAVLDGKTVHWSNDSYKVLYQPYGTINRLKDDPADRWIISCSNGHSIGLTWSDGVTLNGKENDFYIAISDEERLRQALLEYADKIKGIAEKMSRSEDSFGLFHRLESMADEMEYDARYLTARRMPS